jgi:hypothetical protein
METTRYSYIRNHGGARRIHACDPGNWSLIVRDVTWIVIPIVRRAASRTNFPMLVFEELLAKFRDP